MTPTIKTSKPTSVTVNTKYSNDKATYYDVAFENGDTGIYAAPPLIPIPLEVGTLSPYTLEVTAKGTNRIITPSPPWEKPAAPVAQPAPVRAGVTPPPRPDKDTQIVRQSMTKAAVDFVAHLPVEQRTPAKVLEMAKLFEDFVFSVH